LALNWESVNAADVRRACEMIADGQHRPRAGAKGIFVTWQGKLLPAKHVLRVAYLLANRMSPNAPLKFASGEGTILRLRKLGFDVSRTSTKANGD
jgi:hypothetical protein